MKTLILLVTVAGLAPAQSNPSWWKYAPPEATALVGIQWKTLHSSLFASAIASELAPGGTFGFPDMEMLRTPDQILVGSPSLLAIEYGTFPIAKLRIQAEAQGLKRVAFKTAELWVSSEPTVKSVAYVSEKLILVGERKTLEDAIGRIANPKDHSYSPLLARAARYSKEDLWVVAARLPDPLASRFLPLEIEATAFEGSVSLWDGLHLVAAIERSSPMAALDFADYLAESLASRPAMSEGTEISTRDRSVLLRMDLNEDQLSSSLRMPLVSVNEVEEQHELAAAPVAPVKPQPRAFVPPSNVPAVMPSTVASALSAEVPDVTASEPLPQGSPQMALPPAPPKPKVIRILGLETGPKEIPLGH